MHRWHNLRFPTGSQSNRSVRILNRRESGDLVSAPRTTDRRARVRAVPCIRTDPCSRHFRHEFTARPFPQGWVLPCGIRTTGLAPARHPGPLSDQAFAATEGRPPRRGNAAPGASPRRKSAQVRSTRYGYRSPACRRYSSTSPSRSPIRLARDESSARLRSWYGSSSLSYRHQRPISPHA